jgi:cobalt-zinc-cadmium efflux system membrane fusion protein
LNKPKPVVVQQPPPGTFRPTPQQWSNLTFAQADDRDFASAISIDGKIATDDDRTSQVFSPLSGHVIDVLAKAGDTVKAGQVLFRVQASEFVQGQSDLVAAKAQLILTAAAEKRQEALLKIQGAALRDVQQSEADLTAAQGALQAVENRLRILGVSDAEIGRLKREPGDRPMTTGMGVPAPISGVVTQRAIGVGQNVASLVNNGGGTPVFTVSDLRRVWLVANVPEADAGALKLAQPITAHVTAFPGRAFQGRVNFIAPAIDPNTRRIAVRATIDNPGGVLRPEMFAALNLVTGPARSAPAVPENAVIYEGSEARVWVARPDRTLELRLIKAGETQNGFVAVLSGLNAGERVVDAGAIFIDRAASSD